jgi:hypothetical protein
MASRKRAGGFPVPEHFKQVDNTLNGFWKPKTEGDGIQGVVGPLVASKGADGKENNFFTLRITVESSGPIVAAGDKPVETETGLLVGIGGRTIAAFLAANEGKEVALVYRGLGRAKPGRNPPKLYDTYVSTESGE